MSVAVCAFLGLKTGYEVVVNAVGYVMLIMLPFADGVVPVVNVSVNPLEFPDSAPSVGPVPAPVPKTDVGVPLPPCIKVAFARPVTSSG